MRDERDIRNRGTAGAGSATSKAEDQTTKDDQRVDERNEETHDKARAAGITGHDDAAPVTGFTPFRAWANRALRRIPPGATLNYAGHYQKVTEITADGQLRLEWEGAATLIPFDERYIPDLLKQLLTVE